MQGHDRTMTEDSAVDPRTWPVGALADAETCVLYLLHERRAPITVGRSRACDIRLPDPTVSLVHCYMERDVSGSLWIHDAGSKNGVHVNRVRVRSKRLKPGMVIGLGRLDLIAVPIRPNPGLPGTP